MPRANCMWMSPTVVFQLQFVSGCRIHVDAAASSHSIMFITTCDICLSLVRTHSLEQLLGTTVWQPVISIPPTRLSCHAQKKLDDTTPPLSILQLCGPPFAPAAAAIIILISLITIINIPPSYHFFRFRILMFYCFLCSCSQFSLVFILYLLVISWGLFVIQHCAFCVVDNISHFVCVR